MAPPIASGGGDDLADLSGEQLLDALEDVTAQLAAAQARQVRVLAALQARPPAATLPGCADKDWVREHVACVLSCSPDYAGHRLFEASLVVRHPDFVALLGQGQLNLGHVRAFAEALAPLDEHGADQVAAQVLPRAAGQSVNRFRAALRRAVLAVRPATDEAQRAANVEDRCVRIRPYAPGVSSLWALLPEADAAAVANAMTALADQVPDLRTADQRRADALVQLVLSGEASRADSPDGSQPLRPLIQVSVALSTLLGLDDQSAELAGVGPIPAPLARRPADDPSGTWRRLLTDRHGHVLEVGRRSYRPPAALADFVSARDQTCRFPHCFRRAEACETDHRVAWADGGSTDKDNLHLLCARHHHLKHETKWQAGIRPDDSTEWISPTGARYIDPPPEPYPIDATCRSLARDGTPSREPPGDPPF